MSFSSLKALSPAETVVVDVVDSERMNTNISTIKYLMNSLNECSFLILCSHIFYRKRKLGQDIRENQLNHALIHNCTT